MHGDLQDYYGVAARSINWVFDRPGDIEFPPPPEKKAELFPRDKTLDDMLTTGENDAKISPCFTRSFLDGHPDVVRLFLNHKDIEIECFRETGLFPIMHATVICQEILDENP